MFPKPHFVTYYEFDVLRLHNEGVKVKNIASQLSKKEGNIRKTKVVVRKKIEKELQKTARSLRIDLDICSGTTNSSSMEIDRIISLIVHIEKRYQKWLVAVNTCHMAEG